MSTVELTREIDGLDLVGALAARGLKGELVSAREYVAVQVDGCDETQLAHVIEDWLHEREPSARPAPHRRLHLRGLASRRIAATTADEAPGRRLRACPRSVRRPTTWLWPSRRRSSPERSHRGRCSGRSSSRSSSRSAVPRSGRRYAVWRRSGLVSFVPNRGVRVRTLSREELREAFLVRAELERPRDRARDAPHHRRGARDPRRGRAAVRRADARAATTRPRGDAGRRVALELGARESRLPRRDLRGRGRAVRRAAGEERPAELLHAHGLGGRARHRPPLRAERPPASRDPRSDRRTQPPRRPTPGPRARSLVRPAARDDPRSGTRAPERRASIRLSRPLRRQRYCLTTSSAAQTGFSWPSRSATADSVTCTPPSISSTAATVKLPRMRLPTGTGDGNLTLFEP